MIAPPKIIPGSKSQSIACERCTYLNAGDAKVCGMCEAELKPPTHEVQANGMWRCGSCSNLNRKGLKVCHQCHTPFYSTVTSSAPSQIFCAKCGFLNDGDNVECVQCDNQLRSALEKIGTDLRDSTNFLARDMGVNINVKCPGCMIVCFVPPATAGLRCGTCHTYFASPTVGDVTNFHMSRLASSISSSFRGFFSRDRSAVPEPEPEAPIGRLLAIGDIAQQRNARSSIDAASESSESLRDSFSVSGGEDETKEPATTNLAASTADELPSPPTVQQPAPSPRVAEVETRQIESPRRTYEEMYPMSPPVKAPIPVAVAVPAATSSAAPMALHAADPQDMIKVEGDIVEL